MLPLLKWLRKLLPWSYQLAKASTYDCTDLIPPSVCLQRGLVWGYDELGWRVSQQFSGERCRRVLLPSSPPSPKSTPIPLCLKPLPPVPRCFHTPPPRVLLPSSNLLFNKLWCWWRIAQLAAERLEILQVDLIDLVCRCVHVEMSHSRMQVFFLFFFVRIYKWRFADKLWAAWSSRCWTSRHMMVAKMSDQAGRVICQNVAFVFEYVFWLLLIQDCFKE